MGREVALSSKLWVVLCALLLAGVVAATSGGTVDAAEGKQSVEDFGRGGQRIGYWESNSRTNVAQQYCNTHHPFTICAEWCEGLERRPTGTLCCLDPVLSDREGLITDCENFVREW
ncbi:MAG: hypothetical protein K0U98_00320 [Deltaproteobacteria bacterium]|nr:hypothetical protein [Deltaproteobacteria bacterium]